MADASTETDGIDGSTAAPGEDSAPERRTRQAIKYPPYISGYGAIPKLFEEIRKASVPPKFTQDFLSDVLEMKSSSHRALIPLLKKLGFLDAANIPTNAYRNYRDDAQREAVMAAQLKAAYADLYRANEYAHKLTKEQLMAKLRSLTGAGEDDRNIADVAATFIELRKLANFEGTTEPAVTKQEPKGEDDSSERRPPPMREGIPLGLSYTINLNLPATTEIEVFNAIFRSLREHLLEQR